jgi:hypothetical protein
LASNFDKTELDLDTVEHDFSRRDTYSTSADGIVLALIQRLRGAEADLPRLRFVYAENQALEARVAGLEAENDHFREIVKAGSRVLAERHNRIAELEAENQRLFHAMTWTGDADIEAAREKYADFPTLREPGGIQQRRIEDRDDLETQL